jgi:hypothetical protein
VADSRRTKLLYEPERLPMHVFPEEDEPLIGHARDPLHRIDCRRTSRPITVTIDGEQVADTPRGGRVRDRPPHALVHPGRRRLRGTRPKRRPPHHLCLQGPRNALGRGGRPRDRVELRAAAERRHAGEEHDAFYNERVDIEVDGEPEERPRTQWS